MTEQCGTPAYIAPEIIREKGYEGYAVDMWSAGVVLFAMLYGTVPFKAGSMKELHQVILRGKFNMKDDISEEARDLLSKILQPNPIMRIGERDILLHPWMNGIEEVEMFTPEENKFIDKEFSYTKKIKASNCSDTESDFFTELNIDTTQNELLKNSTTKSIILAPFNSTKSDVSKMEERIDNLIVHKKIIKFSPAVKDLDRQYEKNNNCELDNGVYNKLICESSSVKNDTFNSLDSFKGYKSPSSPNHEQKEKKSGHSLSMQSSMPIIPSVFQITISIMIIRL